MTLKDIAKQLTTAVQTVPNLVQILRDGLNEATAGSAVEVIQVVSSGTKIATISVDDENTDIYAPAVTHQYSTTERIIGKWIDGSDIYEKTITGLSTTLNGTTWVHLSDEAITDAKDIIDAKCYRTAGGNLTTIALSEAQSNNGNVIVASFAGVTSVISDAIITYTKVTT